MHSAKRIGAGVLSVVFIILLLVIVKVGCAEDKSTKYSGTYVDVLSNTTAIRQLNAPVFVLDYCGSKYILNLKVRGKNANSLLSMENGEILFRFSNKILLVGYCNGFIYYTPIVRSGVFGSLECLDISSMETETLACMYEVDPFRATIYGTSGEVFIPLDKNSDGYHYVAVLKNQILCYKVQACAVQIESSQYYMTLPEPVRFMSNLYTGEQVMMIDKNGAEHLIDLGTTHKLSTPVAIFEACNKCIVYCDQGLEFILSTDHKPELIFSCECIHSETAFAIHGTNALISVQRYEKLGQTTYGYQRYPNDEFVGTYLVDFLNVTIRKISDSTFCGLFCPDESSAYGCDENGDIYVIQFSGESEMIYAQKH